MVSPGSSPAWAAGLSGSVPALQATGCLVFGSSLKSLTHEVTAPILAGELLTLRSSGTPTNANSAHSVANARMKWVTEPAVMTIVRFHTGKRHIARFSSPGSTSSSCGVIPTIFTKPPRGSALTPYSVSPRRNDHSVGPKPTK